MLYYRGFTDRLGADPVQAILHFTGTGAFNLLLLSLLVSPVAKWLKQGQLINVRRVLGVYAFTYALCHFLSYLIFDLQLEWALAIAEIIKRPYITVGFIGLIILMVLTITSPQLVRKKMRNRWQQTHNWVYAAVLCVALHFLWSVKSGLAEPLIYLVITLILLSTRYKKLSKLFNKA